MPRGFLFGSLTASCNVDRLVVPMQGQVCTWNEGVLHIVEIQSTAGARLMIEPITTHHTSLSVWFSCQPG
jgi:hypothetical protein